MKEVKESVMKSADDLIVKSEMEKLGKPIPDTPKDEKIVAQETEKKEETLETETLENTDSQDLKAEEQEPSEKEEEIKEDKPIESSSDDDIDEYGTKVGKKKLYTEEEVQRMIRDRLKRGQHSEQTEVTQAAKDFKPDPDSTESWETQLEGFVEKTIQKISQKHTEAEYRQKEDKMQAEFEVKFSEGMNKYKDFREVVSEKPITNAMMLATRSMKDPAAFIYAAAKQHPKELARIAQIGDAVTQATEIGRLEERMKKARHLPTAPKPATKISGDASSEMPQLDIDARIAQHAKTKIMR